MPKMSKVPKMPKMKKWEKQNRKAERIEKRKGTDRETMKKAKPSLIRPVVNCH
jgi:hypothetical protein